MLHLSLWRRMLRVTALAAAGHGLADKRKGLMTVEAAQLDDFAVQFEALIGEGGFAETDSALVAIDQLRAAQKADVDVVQIRIGEIPELDGAKILEMNR